MVEDKDEILGKKDKIIIGVMLAFVFSFVIILNYYGYFENKLRDEVLENEFQTTVIELYVDKKNHMTPKVRLSNKEEMVNFFPENSIQLILGDSLVKKKKSTDMLV